MPSQWAGTVSCDPFELAFRIEYMFASWLITVMVHTQYDTTIKLFSLPEHAGAKPWLSSEVLIKYQGIN